MYQQPYMQWIEAPAGTETAVPVVRDADTNELTIKAGCAPKRKTERADGFRTMFKAIDGSYTNAVVMKKLKTADGTPADANFLSDADAHLRSDPAALFVGIAGDLIRQHDTVFVPISQFEFSEADISQFGGNKDFLLQGHVTSVQKVTLTLNIKFVGDSHASPYPKEGFG
jgi:hypothetical protein